MDADQALFEAWARRVLKMTDRDLQPSSVRSGTYCWTAQQLMWESWRAARAAVLAALLIQGEAASYAKQLAESLWRKHFREDTPDWKPLDDLVGILTQIDNMTTTLVRRHSSPPATPIPPTPQPGSAHLTGAVPGETVQAATLYYMRDNHTFKRLTLNVEAALAEIRAEFDDGYTHGSLCSKSPGMPDMLHASGGPFDKFAGPARAWLSAALSAPGTVEPERPKPDEKNSAAGEPLVGLSDERIIELAKAHTEIMGSHFITSYVNFARAIESALRAEPRGAQVVPADGVARLERELRKSRTCHANLCLDLDRIVKDETPLNDFPEVARVLEYIANLGAPAVPQSPPTPEVGLPAGEWQSSADDIRAAGWTVAVHNDYRLGGKAHTFWLFTKGDRAVKGEGETDAQALNAIRAHLSARVAPPAPQEGWQPIETAPVEGEWALVFAGGAVNCAYVQRGKLPDDWCRAASPNVFPEYVTHWMPIPPAPPVKQGDQ